ncbi:MAG: flagellar export chaperone FliS [Acidobacteriia bacterium]|nr:flagellar export chaperone FliS [Terriglobia bacterium]
MNRQNEYLSQRVETASPVELIRILYEAALRTLDEALAALYSGDILKRGRAVTKAIEILSELQMSLRCDVQPEYSNTLAGLYSYMQQQLIRAHAEQSESRLQEVARLLRTLLEGWIGAMQNLATGTESHAALESQPEAHAASTSNPYSTDSPSAPPAVRSWRL